MTAYDYYGIFFSELASRGVRHVVCSPGSRSAPLVLCARADRRLQCWVQLDERAGGFFALGLAKAHRTCVALICTSGSAAANYLPAVTEAYYDGVGLIVLTADRPPELRDRGAGQTIDQIHLYGSHVRWSADLPVAGEVDADHARYAAGRAVATALGPPGGPVHLNVPLREPLEPTGATWLTGLAAGVTGPDSDLPGAPADTGESVAAATPAPAAPTAATRIAAETTEAAAPAELAAAPAEAAALVDLLRGCERGLFAVGPADLSPADAGALKRLAALAGWPLIADSASGLRTGPAGEGDDATVVATGHHLAITHAFWEAHRPDVIVRVGHPTAGRALREGLAAWGVPVILVDPQDRWPEPTTVPAARWRSAIGPLARAALAILRHPDAARPAGPTVGGAGETGADGNHGGRDGEGGGVSPPASARSSSAWTEAWGSAELAVQEVIDEELSAALDAGPLLEAGVARTLAFRLRPESVLYASNSMPVRDLDAFLEPRADGPRVVAHRGTNGIDGVVSAAAGMAAGTEAPVVALAGDLALLHDLGGLLGAVRLGLDLTIVVPNNNGGGIFSFLPVAEAVPPDVFGRFFHTPHDIDLAALVAGLGARHNSVEHPLELAAALDAALAAPGVHVIEVPVDTAANVAQHRAIEAAVRAFLAPRERAGGE